MNFTQKLKRNGYERIVFFDNDQKLYCYDDESFKLLKTTKKESPTKTNAGASTEPRSGKGLRRGRNAHRMGSAVADTALPSAVPQEGAVQQEPEDTESRCTFRCAGEKYCGRSTASWNDR